MKSIKVLWFLQKKDKKLKPYDWRPENGYFAGKPLFSWASRPLNGVLKQVSRWHGCRETLTSEIKRCYFPESSPGTWSTFKKNGISHPKIGLRRFYIIELFKGNPQAKRTAYAEEHAKRSEDSVKAGLRAINVIEKYMGWPLSTVYSVDRDSIDQIYVVSGPGKWVIAPQMLSLYLLILRLGGHPKKHLKHFTEVSDESFNAVAKAGGYSQLGDIGYWTQFRKKIKLFLDNYERIFGDTTLEDNYRNWTGRYGISRLMADTNAVQRRLRDTTPNIIPAERVYPPATIKWSNIFHEGKNDLWYM